MLLAQSTRLRVAADCRCWFPKWLQDRRSSAARGRRSSKPVRSCSPRLGRFDSCAAPSEETPADPQVPADHRICSSSGFVTEICRQRRLQAFRTIAQTIARHGTRALNPRRGSAFRKARHPRRVRGGDGSSDSRLEPPREPGSLYVSDCRVIARDRFVPATAAARSAGGPSVALVAERLEAVGDLVGDAGANRHGRASVVTMSEVARHGWSCQGAQRALLDVADDVLCRFIACSSCSC